jgi:class 3 adenylate cyclase
MAEVPLPSGMVTFLLTDVEGSTRIWESDRGWARSAFERHDALVAEHLASCGGARPRDQGEGDSAFAVFARASAAVACALALQRALYAEAWPPGASIRVRMALHTGEAELANGNYKGSAVHRCARLRGLAHGGQIVMSEATAQIVRDQLPRDVTLRDMGVHELRGLVRSERVYQLCHPELPGDFPPLQSGSGRPRDLPTGLQVPLPASLANRGEDAFVGRRAELAALERQWRTTGPLGARLVLVGGEAGIGKTRLAAQFAATAHERGSTVLFGRCDEEALRPYQPVAEALSSYLHALPADSIQYRLGRSATELSTLVPELSDRVPGAVGSSWSDAGSMRFRMFEAVALLLTELGTAAPVLLVLDDLQWADRATLLLVRHLTRHADLGRVLLLATHRDEATSSLTPFADMLIELDREHVVSHVRLTGLDDADVMALLDPGTRERPGARALALAQTLRDGTDGNPFFVRETLRHLAENGDIYQEDGKWVASTRLNRLGVPTGVRGVVAQRLARFSDAANRVFAAAAVIGREFRLDVLNAVTDLDEESLFETLDDAVRAGLLREVPAVVGAYTFSHALVRQTIYEGLTTNRRARLHHRVGNALEAFFVGRPDAPLAELAYHYCQAAGLGDDAKAIEYATRAGDRATQQLAYEDAGRQYAMALHVLNGSSGGDDARRYELLCRVGEAAWRASDVLQARATFREAAQLARQLGDPTRLATAALGFGGAGFRPWWSVESRDAEESVIQLLEEALDAFEPGDSPARVQLLGSLAHQLYLSGELERRRRLADESVAMARRLDDPTTLVQALLYWRIARWQFSNAHERLAVSNEALELARALDQRELVMQALTFRLVDLMELGDITAADADAAVLESTARELHVPYYQWATILYSAMRALLEGRFAEAEALRTDGYELGLRADPMTAAGLAGAQLAVLCREQGRVDELQAIIAEAHRVVPTSLVWRAAGVMASLAVGNLEQARIEFEACAACDFADVPDDFFRSITWALLADSCARLGDADRAELLYSLLLPHRDQLVLLTNAVVFLGSVSHYLGTLALTTGSFDDAAHHLEEAMACHLRLGAAPFHARSRLAYVRLLVARGAPGDEGQARPMLDSVIDVAARLGMHSLLDEATALQ